MSEQIDARESSEAESTPPEPPFQSQLKDGRQRFLSHVVVQGLEVARRSPADFVRHFDPSSIMRGLADAPSLRAGILSPSTGIKPKIALRKSWQSAADDLQIALDVGATDPGEIVAGFAPDDRVRYLDPKRLWAYVVEGDFWKSPANETQGVAKSHVAFMMCQALRDDLITHRDIVEGVTVGEIAARVPRVELGKIIESALDCGHRAQAYTEKRLLDDMPPERLVEHVPLPHIWQSVVCQRIADVHGYGASGEEPAAADEIPQANDNVERGWSNLPPAEVRKSSKRNSKRPRGAG
jgi:hypothetical protein